MSISPNEKVNEDEKLNEDEKPSGSDVPQGAAASDAEHPFVEIPVSSLVPNNWNFNAMPPALLPGLVKVVKQRKRVIHPLIVRQNGGGLYEIIDGEHQYKAAVAAGLQTVTCEISILSDFQSGAETARRNELRGESNKVLLARALLRMRRIAEDAGGPQMATNSALARTIGGHESFVRQTLPYAELAGPAGTRPDIAGFPKDEADVAGLAREKVVELLQVAREPPAKPIAAVNDQSEPDEAAEHPTEEPHTENNPTEPEQTPDPDLVTAERISRLLTGMTAESRARVIKLALTRVKEAERQKSAAKKRGRRPEKTALVRRTRRAAA